MVLTLQLAIFKDIRLGAPLTWGDEPTTPPTKLRSRRPVRASQDLTSGVEVSFSSASFFPISFTSNLPITTSSSESTCWRGATLMPPPTSTLVHYAALGKDEIMRSRVINPPLTQYMI